jgi:hypothetical protein
MSSPTAYQQLYEQYTAVETQPQCFYEIDNATTLAWKNAQVTPIPPKM